MKVACAKGCGYTIEVTKEAVQEMIELGADIVVSHDKCPNDPEAPQYDYRIVTQVFGPPQNTGRHTDFGDEVWEPELLASFGDTVQAGNFTEAVPALGTAMQSQWERIVGMASTIDNDTPEE